MTENRPHSLDDPQWLTPPRGLVGGQQKLHQGLNVHVLVVQVGRSILERHREEGRFVRGDCKSLGYARQLFDEPWKTTDVQGSAFAGYRIENAGLEIHGKVHALPSFHREEVPGCAGTSERHSATLELMPP